MTQCVIHCVVSQFTSLLCSRSCGTKCHGRSRDPGKNARPENNDCNSAGSATVPHPSNGAEHPNGCVATALRFFCRNATRFLYYRLPEAQETSCAPEQLKSLKKKLQKQEIKNDAYTVYFEDIPQLILQVYIIWKTPRQCLDFATFSDFVQYGSILTSILSISGTIVPFANVDENNYTSSTDSFHFTVCGLDSPFEKVGTCMTFIIKKVLKNEIFFCTVFMALPKLMLFSWVISILGWGSLILFVPIVLGLLCYHLCYRLLKNQGGPIDILVATSKDFMGYSGRDKKNLLPSIILLALFVIPLSIALHASINTSFNSKMHDLGIFPSDPFPSWTICFTNSSRDMQEEKWGNLTTPWSPTCNITFTAQPCEPPVQEFIQTILSILLIFMCLGFIVGLIIANLPYILVCICLAIALCIALAVPIFAFLYLDTLGPRLGD